MFFANILLFVNIIVSVLLVIIILLQRASSGLGALGGGGSSAAFSSASAGNALTKATTVLAILFMLSSLLLAIELGGKGRQTSVIDKVEVEKNVEQQGSTTPEIPFELPNSKKESTSAK